MSNATSNCVDDVGSGSVIWLKRRRFLIWELPTSEIHSLPVSDCPDLPQRTMYVWIHTLALANVLLRLSAARRQAASPPTLTHVKDRQRAMCIADALPLRSIRMGFPSPASPANYRGGYVNGRLAGYERVYACPFISEVTH